MILRDIFFNLLYITGSIALLLVSASLIASVYKAAKKRSDD